MPFAWSCAGLTKVPIDGQPRSIVRDLEEMARTYIKVDIGHCFVRKASKKMGNLALHFGRYCTMTAFLTKSDFFCRVIMPSFWL